MAAIFTSIHFDDSCTYQDWLRIRNTCCAISVAEKNIQTNSIRLERNLMESLASRNYDSSIQNARIRLQTLTQRIRSAQKLIRKVQLSIGIVNGGVDQKRHHQENLEEEISCKHDEIVVNFQTSKNLRARLISARNQIISRRRFMLNEIFLYIFSHRGKRY